MSSQDESHHQGSIWSLRQSTVGLEVGGGGWRKGDENVIILLFQESYTRWRIEREKPEGKQGQVWSALCATPKEAVFYTIENV